MTLYFVAAMFVRNIVLCYIVWAIRGTTFVYAARTGIPLLVLVGLCSISAAPSRAGECVPPAHQATQEAVKAFADAPSSLLGQTGGRLATSVRNLAVTSPAAIAAMPKLASGATAEQLGAIGSGLGQASLVCRRTAPDMALAIQKSVVGSEKPEVAAAYEAVVQEQVTTATGPGGPSGDVANVVSGDSIEGGGPFPDRSTDRAGGVLPLTSYYATSAILASGSGRETTTRFIAIPTTSSQGATTTLLVPSTSGAFQSVSPSR